MKKYTTYILLLCFSLTMVSCQSKPNMNEEKRSLYRENDINGQNEIGLFTYEPKNYKNSKEFASTIVVDRSLLAKHISYLVGILPNIEKVTTLVTDDHVFIGIKQTDAKKSAKTLKEVKRTAESVTPRYFHIHVTDNKSLEEKINTVGIRMRGTHDVEGVKGDLEQLLRDMGDENPPNVNESIQPNTRKDVNPNER